MDAGSSECRAFCVGHTSSRGDFQFAIKRRPICNLIEGSRIPIGALCPVPSGNLLSPVFYFRNCRPLFLRLIPSINDARSRRILRAENKISGIDAR